MQVLAGQGAIAPKRMVLAQRRALEVGFEKNAAQIRVSAELNSE
jgi:hypothetical protein